MGNYWYRNIVADEWNKLPSEVKNTNTLASFKHKLERCMKSTWETPRMTSRPSVVSYILMSFSLYTAWVPIPDTQFYSSVYHACIVLYQISCLYSVTEGSVFGFYSAVLEIPFICCHFFLYNSLYYKLNFYLELK